MGNKYRAAVKSRTFALKRRHSWNNGTENSPKDSETVTSRPCFQRLAWVKCHGHNCGMDCGYTVGPIFEGCLFSLIARMFTQHVPDVNGEWVVNVEWKPIGKVN